jgi:hypothetical protein
VALRNGSVVRLPARLHLSLGIRFFGSVSVRFLGYLRNSVPEKLEPFGSQKKLEPASSVLGSFGSVSVSNRNNREIHQTTTTASAAALPHHDGGRGGPPQPRRWPRWLAPTKTVAAVAHPH